MKFIAHDLEDIAGMFDKIAAREREWAGAAKSATARKMAEITAHVWDQAAGIVRDTEIRPGK